MSQRERLRTTFGEDAELYDRMRPGYPSALFDDLAVLGGLRVGSRVLEIGPGTGQATRSLVERGYRVTCVELSPVLAGVLRARLGASVEVVVGAFEDVPLSDVPPFDMVFAATAFHWIDPQVRLARSAALLRPGGVLATVRTEHVAGGDTEFFHLVQRCYERWDPATPPGLLLEPATVIPFDTAELEGCASFEVPIFRRYEWEQPYSTAEYIDLLLTYSGHRALPPADLRGLLECISGIADRQFGGRVTKRYMNELRLAQRR